MGPVSRVGWLRKHRKIRRRRRRRSTASLTSVDLVVAQEVKVIMKKEAL
jgi:hypothetical protein